MIWREFMKLAPSEVMAHIYEYDDTYRTHAYQQVMAEFHVNQWLEWKQTQNSIHPWLPMIGRILDYVLDEMSDIDEDVCVTNIQINHALHCPRVRRMLWHHVPSDDALLFLSPRDKILDTPTPYKSCWFMILIGDEYRFCGTIAQESWYRALWQDPRDPPSPRMQDSITIYQDESYRILQHL